MRSACAVVPLIGLVLASSCGASPTSPPRESYANQPTPPRRVDARVVPDELRAWAPPPAGEYLLTTAFLRDGQRDEPARGTIRLTEPRVVRLDADGEHRFRMDGHVWVLRGAPSLCSRDATVFEGDDLRWEVPAGTPLRVVGVDEEAGMARVAPGSSDDPSVLVARHLLSLAACDEAPDGPESGSTADTSVPEAPDAYGPCIFSAPSRGGFRVPLEPGWPMRVLAQHGSWRRVTVLAGGGSVSGWLPPFPEPVEDAAPEVERSMHRTTAAVTLNGLTVPAGSLVQLEIMPGGRRVVAWADVHGLSLELRTHALDDEPPPISEDVLQPAPDPGPPPDDAVLPGLGSASCWYPDATPPNTTTQPVGSGEVVRGALPKSAIRDVVRRHIQRVRYCYERVLAHQDYEGRVVFTWIIAPTGQVQSVAVAETVSDPDRHPYVDRCLAREISRWEFPPPEGGGIVVVNYPFQLTIAP